MSRAHTYICMAALGLAAGRGLAAAPADFSFDYSDLLFRPVATSEKN